MKVLLVAFSVAVVYRVYVENVDRHFCSFMHSLDLERDKLSC